MVRIPLHKKIYYLFLEELRLAKKKSLFKKFRKLNEVSGRFNVEWADRIIFFNEDTAETSFDTHYIYHPAWAARIVKQIAPIVHVDISSTLAFGSMLSAYVPVQFYDYRPAKLFLSDLYCGQADLTKLPFEDKSIASLSCMHVIEHIGLGRYGDPLDAEGDLKAISELKRVLAPGGSLLLVTPVGKQRIQWNAHRIYAYESIADHFKGDFTIQEFTLIPDNAEQEGILYNASPNIVNAQKYGCGCWWIKRTDG